MILATLGFLTVFVFIVLIMAKRLSSVVALIAVPIVSGLLAGAGPGLGPMMLKGVVEVAPIAIMLAFAILYFGVMMDAGLFDPLVRRILSLVGDDPVRIALGTTALTALVSLDGDGTTTALIVITALLPVYRAVRMNPLILAFLLGASNSLMNFVPWGGPAARAAAALKVDLVAGVFLPLLPAVLLTLVAVFALAWHLGRQERQRLGWIAGGKRVASAAVPENHAERRPRLFWLNLLLTLALVVAMALSLAPLPVLLMSAFVIAVTLNYPRLQDQRARLSAHADNVMMVVLLIFAAGAFTGILSGTGMIDAMAQTVLAALPPRLGPYLAPIVAVLSMPFTFLMSNDAYYFGVVPVLANAAAQVGIAPEVIARASLLGQPVHTLSPLLAPIYLACGLLGVEVGDAQRFSLKYAVAVSLTLIAAAMLTGAIPLRV